MRAEFEQADDFRIQIDWLPDDQVKSPELAATWASLEMWVGGECITRVEDLATGSSRRGIFVSVYPLAEWVAFNWWWLAAHTRPLMYDADEWRFERQPHRWEPARPVWLPSHNMRGAGEGMAWPDLALVPDSPKLQLRWFPDHIGTRQAQGALRGGPRVRFLSGGAASVDKEEGLGVLAGLVNAVLQRLDEAGLTRTPLADEWTAVRSAEPEEIEFCEFAARLGMDPYQETSQGILEELIEVAEGLQPSLALELAGVASLDRFAASARWVKRAGDVVVEPSGSNPVVSWKLPPRTDGPPWIWGYRAARNHRDGASIMDPFDVDRFVTLTEDESPEPLVRAVAGRSREGRVGVFSGAVRGEPGRRFVAARGLWQALASGGRRLGLVTDAHTYSQRAGRAYAAELLAPAAGIVAHLELNDPVVSWDECARIGEVYGVSPMVIQHQIENHLGRRVLPA